jgi:hypothetical protein
MGLRITPIEGGGERAMRGLLAGVIVMGVLILVATAAMIALVIHRATTPRPAAPREGLAAPVVLNEPPGTRIATSEASDNRLLLQLSGGGPDRVVVVNLRDGAVLARVLLAR